MRRIKWEEKQSEKDKVPAVTLLDRGAIWCYWEREFAVRLSVAKK